jgi:carboxylesterase
MAIVVMSTPIYLYDWRIHFLWLAQRLKWAVPKGQKRQVDTDERYNVAYDCLPLRGVRETWKLITRCKRKVLKKVTAPCLIIQSKADHTVRPLSAQFIYKTIASRIKQIFYLEHSRHVVTLFQEREQVFREIEQFIKEQV